MAAITEELHLCFWLGVLVIALILKECSPIDSNMSRTLSTVTAEDLRFAESRCQNDSNSASSELKRKWAQRIYPDNAITHCYVQCFLRRLGLIDINNRGLNWEKLYIIWSKNEKDFDDQCLEDSFVSLELDGTCYSYYKAWRSLWENCKQLMTYVIINQYPGRSKAIGITASEFCYSLTKANDVASESSSDSRGSPSFNDTYECNLECIFRHFHYFDAYGRIDQIEILQSLVEAHVSTPKNIAAVRICSNRANSLFSFGYCEMAFELKKCLVAHSLEFLSIYGVRDKMSQYY